MFLGPNLNLLTLILIDKKKRRHEHFFRVNKKFRIFLLKKIFVNSQIDKYLRSQSDCIEKVVGN